MRGALEIHLATTIEAGGSAGTVSETHPAQQFVHDWFDTSSPLGRADFGWAAERNAFPAGLLARQWVVVFPLWLVAAMLSFMTAVRLYRRVRQRRRAPGLCPFCGYDLRVTPGRCPECGHVPRPVDKLSEG